MGVAHPCRTRRATFGLPSLWCITLFAATAATAAVVTRAQEKTNAPSSRRIALSTDMLHDENLLLHPSTPLNLVVGQSVGGFEPSVIRRQKKQGQISQPLAVTAGLAAVVCLVVAFVVLQCARKALLPRVFGSLGKRALSNSDVEEQLVVCIQEEDENIEGQAGEAGAGAAGRPSGFSAEARALATLEQLRWIMDLGKQTSPCLKFEKKAFLCVLLFTICTQELILYGVHSTPAVELERQQTMDYILREGKRAVEQLEAGGQSSNAARRAKKVLKLLEKFRTPPGESSPKHLDVEARISAYRIFQCRHALEQLQPWVGSSMPIPDILIERVLKVLSCTRGVGKARLRADAAATSWVRRAQATLNSFLVMEMHYRGYSVVLKASLEEEMEKLKQRFQELSTLLRHSIESARPQLEQHLEQQRQQLQQRQQQGVQHLQREQHLPSDQLSEDIAVLSSALQHLEQHTTLRSGAMVLPPQPSWPYPAPSHGTWSAPNPSLRKPPVVQSTRPPLTDSVQHIPVAFPGPWDQPRLYSSPGRHETQPVMKYLQQSSRDLPTVPPVPRRHAPMFTPTEPPYTAAPQDASFIFSVAKDVWGKVPPPPGFTVPWRLAVPSTGVQSPFTLPDPPAIPIDLQREYLTTTFPAPAPSGESFTSLHHSPDSHQSPPRAVFTSPPPLQRSEGLSLHFSAPSFQNPVPQTPRHAAPLLAPLHISFGDWPPTSASQVVARADSPQIVGEGAHGGTSLHSVFETRLFDPVGPLIAEEFSVAGRLGPVGAERARRREHAWLRFPPRQPASPLGAVGETFPVVGSKLPLPSGSQGSWPAAEAAPQTQMGAPWSLWKDARDGSGQL